MFSFSFFLVSREERVLKILICGTECIILGTEEPKKLLCADC